MVEQILSLGLERKKDYKLKYERVDLNGLLDKIVEQQSIKSSKPFHVGLESMPDRIILEADRTHLYNILSNILDNAIKYSAPGGRITVKSWQGEYKAFIEIIDQGRGIPPEDLENVKTKFYKGSNSVRGSGIGLALVDSIMTALDGTMDLKSTLGRGTVVTLGLPIYKR